MKRTIGFKMTMLFVLFALILVLALGVFSYLNSWESFSRMYWDDARNAANTAAAFIDGNRIAGYVQSGEKDAYYHELQQTLNLLKKELGVMYLYVYAPGSDSFTYIMEARLSTDDPDKISDLGDVFEYGHSEYEYLLPDVLAKRGSSQVVVLENEYYGHSVSAWAPVFDDGGELSAMVEAEIPLDIVEENLASFIWVLMALACFVIAVLVVMLYLLMRRMISKPLKKLTRDALSFVSGEQLVITTDVIRSGDEMQTLSEAFAKMAGDIDAYTINLAAVTADRERIATELDVATRIQSSMLPSIFPAFPDRAEFDIYATMLPAKEVGGDFYDFFLVDDKTLAVVMADVSGKGVPAALFMVIAKTLIKNNAQLGKSPAEVFETVNKLLCENNEAGMFVTAFMGYLDIKSGKFTFVNAGHNPPLISAGGKFDWLKAKRSFVLAGMDGMPYKQHEVELKPGDELFLYTDGVTEAMNPNKKLFTEARLLDIIRAKGSGDLKELLSAVKLGIDEFAAGAEQADDITMLALRYKGAEPDMAELVVRAELDNIKEVQTFIAGRLKECPVGIRKKISVAVDEIFANIARYAYGESGGGVTIRLVVGEDICIEFEDSGVAYNPLSSEEPDVSLPANEREVGGLGVFMVKKLMDSVEYRREGTKNILTISKKLE